MTDKAIGKKVIMRSPFSLFALLLVVFDVLVWGPYANAELPDKPEQLLELLRARDRQFDNAHLSYVRRGMHTPVRLPRSKYPPPPGETKPAPAPKPRPFRFDEQMTIRGPYSTFVRDVDPTEPVPPDSNSSFLPHQKWSDTEGLEREFRETPQYKDRSLHISRGGSTSVGILDVQRREVEFSLGFGFGSKIKTISAVKRKEGQLELEGTLQLWWEDVSPFHLTIDDDLVVRNAVIEIEVKGNQTRYEVTTEGTVKVDDFVFAKTGHYKRIAMGLKNPPAKFKGVFKPKVTDEFFIDFKKVKFNLDDNEYKDLVNMDVPPGTHVTDEVTNKRYYVGQDNRVSEVVPLGEIKTKPTTVLKWGMNRNLFIVIVTGHLIVLLLLVKFLQYRGKLKRAK